MNPSPTPQRIDRRWVETRARLQRLLLENAGLLPDGYVVWGQSLIIEDEMASHPYAPWQPQAAWYLDQIDLFLGAAGVVIDRELAPYRDAIPQKREAA